MTADQELEQLLGLVAACRVKLVSKSGWFWRALGAVVKIVTFGNLADFQTGYLTTIGSTIALPVGWERRDAEWRLEVLTHELVHVDQSQRLTAALMSFLYLFAFFPVGLAYARYVFEREAYVAGFKTALRYGADRQALIDHGVSQMTGPNYLWAWPFKASVRKYFEDSL